MKNSFVILFIFVVTAVHLGTINIITNIKDNETSVLVRKLKTDKQIIDYLECQIDTLESMVAVSYDAAYTFQIVMGVKEPNGIVDYKDKLLTTPLAIQKLNHYKILRDGNQRRVTRKQ